MDDLSGFLNCVVLLEKVLKKDEAILAYCSGLIKKENKSMESGISTHTI
jgi:hypothetical protein